ncbi:BspA family leucine-rich repeat surface protein [Tamlana sp. 62-3]|uniref:BspA family leucine-rich repeat surface protein n=1 Tax=Neotamlana sargassicola TaxID=2883125 RepID=A0A9X1I3R2_9FLAO|nr:BspA family leucine-rich repeat surface protein [Tamlana sargassicola]MCB4806993.1 BspA family leucine-rich repeat surface protein [Tamlana sargassicola]
MQKIYLVCFALLIGLNLFSQNFRSSWNTNNIEVSSSADYQITIPTNPAYTYNYTVNWGDGNTDTGVTGNITHDYATPGNYNIEISGDFPAIYFNDDNTNDKLKIIEILEWGSSIQWQTMENAFYGCENLNFDLIDSPDLSQVTTLKNMFRECTSFNGIVNNWDISTITNLSGMFYECDTFNRPLDLWNTSNVTDMSETFYGTNNFNEPLDNWNTARVTNMYRMFRSASRFNQNINNWTVNNVTNMSGTFSYANNFNEPLNNWNVANVTDMSNMFDGSDFNHPIGNWNVSNVTNMSGMFRHAVYNHPLENWDVSSVVDFSEMFQRHRTFNQPLNTWNVSNATDMSGMFDGWIWGQVFNQPLDNWNVSNVTNMSYMFRDNTAFNQDISGWNVSNVTNMAGMFEDTSVFNQDISSWNVSSVTNMQGMFQQTDAFNQPLNNWNVSNVSNVSNMFSNAAVFNQPLNNWSLNNVTNFSSMFNLAIAFNQDISNWDTSGVTNMSNMFNGATSFNLNIGPWNIAAVTNMTNMLSNSGISQENYDNILIAWSVQTVQNNVSLGATNLQYCDALNQRQSLIDDDGWAITGDAVNCSYVLCTEITMPHSSDTATPANSDIRWDPAPNATGYRITLEIERGGVRSYATIGGNIANNYDVGNVVGLDFTNEFQAGDTVFVTVVPYNDEGPATGCTETSFTVVESWVNRTDVFKFTIDTRNLDTGSTAANQYRIELNDGYPDYLTYDFNIDWGDGQYDNNVTTDITHTYLNPGIYTIAIIGDFPAFYHDSSNRDNDKLISMDQWGNQVWQSMEQAFYYCENMEYNATDIPNLTQVENMSGMFVSCDLFNSDISNWDVSNVTNMSSLFLAANSFNQPLNNWNISNVTNTSAMFFGANSFDQPLDNWDTSNVTNMSRMFRQATVFNQTLNNWNLSNVTDTSQMFSYTDAFNQPLNNWNVSNVINMEEMFHNAELFNQNIDSWEVTNVTNMAGMFNYAPSFNEPLNSWNVSSVTNMASMFSGADAFNQPLNNWDVSNVTTMASMFNSADNFNQNIDSWNVTNVTNMSYMFNNASSFNQPLNSWDVNSVVNMSSMFRGTTVFNQPLANWDVSAVANMSNMFEEASAFNQPLNTWNVSSVTLMPSMFEGATVYNQEMDNWDVAVVTNFEAMFKEASAFNQPLNSWNTGEALTMEAMFYGATVFNQPLDSWNTTFVTSMEDMFREASAFNQTLNSWNVASVTTMESMFQEAIMFNGDIDSWNVRAVTTMADMFNGASAFNKPLNSWRTTNVTTMDRMFQEAIAFNQPLNQWLFGNVTMRAMFHDATAFNQYLGDWDVSGVTDMRNMLDDTALTRENYDNTLIAWSEQNLTPGITLGAASLLYCDAQDERQSMIDTFGWTINSDILDCPIPECTQLTSPLSGATDVPVNTNITWEHALYAEGYYLTVGTSPGGNDILDNEAVVNETFYEFTTNFNTGDVIYITIIPYNYVGNAVGPCTEESFTISNNAASVPECTTLIEPINGATDVEVTTDLIWNAISNADGYKLSVGTTSGGTDLVNNEDVGNVTEYDFTTDLPEDTDIFVTITPYNEEGDATSCTEESFRTKFIPIPPACTTLSNPLNVATNISTTTDLTWNTIADATGYLISVGTTSGGVEIVNSIDVGNVTSYTFSEELQENRIYYVRITPYNNVGDASGCSEESFTTAAAPTAPSCTTLTSPLNGATDVSVATDLSWTAITDVTGYRLTVGTTSGGNDILDNENVGNVSTYDLANDLPETTTIYVTITPYNAVGDATGCSEESFTTETLPTAPTCTTLTSPLNGATDVSVATDLSWTAITDATGYRLTVGTTSGGNDILDSEDVGNVSTYDLASDLPETTTIYVTIIPYNAVGDATGCSEESFTTETLPTAPTCTTLTSPLNGVTDVAVSTDLSWTAITDATGYRLTVGTTSGGNDILNTEDVGNVSTYDLANDLPETTTIYVTIIPYNAVGDATGCTEESFTTETLPTAPTCTTLTSPLNGATDVAVSTDLSWTAITDATGYRITVGTTSGGNDILDNEDVGNVSTYDLANDLPETTIIYATITPYNAVGDATGCTEESFTTETLPTAPTCTTLTSPLNGATDVAVSTDLSWTAITDATGYRLTVGTTSGGNDILDNEDVGNVSTYDLVTDLPETTTIYVTITPYNAVGDATGCTEESFTTETLPTAPTCTTLTSPLNGATDVAVSTDLSWTAITDATGYRLTVGTTSGGNDILDNEDVGNVSTYDLVTDLPETTTIYVTITPYNAVGDATGCTEESFTTETLPTVPGCTTLTSPLNGATDVAVSTDLSWTAITDATGYRLTVGTTSGGNDILGNEDVGNVSTYNLASDLPETTTIYVTIIPYNTVGDATGCTEESFTTETLATIPDCTRLTSPVNGESDVSVSTDLSWQAIAEATGYKLTVGLTFGGNEILNNEDVGNVTTYNLVSDLPESTEIYVTIIPYNLVGDATVCTEEAFITETFPSEPICAALTSPTNGATDVSVATDFNWDAVTDATGYRLTIGTTSNGNDILDNEDIGNVTTFNLTSDLPENSTIYVTITPYNAVGDAVSCTEQSFTTEVFPTIPNCTELVSPYNGETEVSTDTYLEWSEISDATGYKLFVGTTSGVYDILDNEDVGNVISYSLSSDLPEGTQIYVVVIAYNDVGEAIGCTETLFTTNITLAESKYGFSPNGDGLNDFWEINGIENSPNNVVNIYNRWGDLVFTIANYNNSSNVFRGEANRLKQLGAGKLPDGTYFFEIKVSGTHNLKKLKGFVVIKR